MTEPNSIEPLVLGRADHNISRKKIHTNALKVLYRLHRSGHSAYLCGGAVRDLLLDRQPKDYDVATSARPPQVRRLFRNSRIIGRRFRLAHVYFREGIIEVSTFRRDPDPEAQSTPAGELLITDDNVFGTPREDAFRRDFTINALFYNIADFSVIDYVGGIEDLERRRMRAIGDPEVRFQEDPVRMMRACELAGRLGFSIERRTQEAIESVRGQIDKAAPARLTEEVLQLLRSGHAGPAAQWMLELGLLEPLLPELHSAIRDRRFPHLARLLPELDRAVAAGTEPSDIALLSLLLLPAVLEGAAEKGASPRPDELRAVAASLVDPFCARFTISKLRAERMVDTLLACRRLGAEDWSVPEKMRFVQKPWFDDAFFLFELSSRAAGEGADGLEDWRAVIRRRPPRRRPARHPERRPRRRRRRRRRQAR